MEFWGVEVKAGKSLTVTPDLGKLIHISQAALGEGKKEKGNDYVPLRVQTNDKKFVVGSLSREKFPQISFDLVFDKQFELSHGWNYGSVYFCGYSVDNPVDEDDADFESDSSDEDMDMPTGIIENGKLASKGEEAKPAENKSKAVKHESSAKPKVTVVEPMKDDVSSEDSSDEDDESSEEDTDDSDDSVDEKVTPSHILDTMETDDSEDGDDSEDEDEETPKKADPSKKRPTVSAIKTPVPAKKAKVDTPQKTDGKKGGGHTATPHPSKQAGNAAAGSSKSKEKTPKSEARVACQSCDRKFNSEAARQSHAKAKHESK